MLTIANWNIARVLPSSRRLTRVLPLLHQCAADIFILTETHQDIKPRENQNAVHSGEPDRTGVPGERWCSIWSEFPLESLNSYISDPARARCAAARLSHPAFGKITVFACILPWLTDKQGATPTAGGNAFKDALRKYREDFQSIREAFPNDKSILAGDFNQSLANHHYYGSAVQKSELEKILKEEKLLPLTAYDNDPVARDSYPHACIDHICISKYSGLTLHSSERWPNTAKPDKTISDHFGIIVKLK